MSQPQSWSPDPRVKRILSIRIRSEHDIVGARRRARQVASLLGFPVTGRAAVAAAVSEIARNAFQYAGGGAIEFAVTTGPAPFLWIEISDHGPGMADLDAVLGGQYKSTTGLGVGIVGARRLMDRFEIASSPQGTRVRFGKSLPAAAKPPDLPNLARELAGESMSTLLEEVQVQNRDLVSVLESLQQREKELHSRQQELERLNVELEETNRGVVALYAELEESASALRRANQLKSQFLSHISHEFRTPVNSIMALTHLLLRRTDGELTSEQEKQVTFIRQAAGGLADMVNDLLDIAKVESGKTEVRLAPVDVSHVLGAVRALMRPLATNDAVALIFEDPPARLTMETDEAKLGQILRNLVSNALKFTERGEVRVSARALDDHIVFSVSDTGIGIAPQDLELVFQEFSQIHHSMQRCVKGTGLGLSLSRKFAGLLGGTLEATSNLGVGSTFVLKLPIHAAPAASPGAVPAFPGPRSGTILVVDDEAAARYICRQMFRRSAYRIIEADSLEAAERARFERPRLIILDLIMPGCSGAEVLDELKSDPMTREIPVIIHTSKTITDADRHRLGDRYRAILPKSGVGRKEALEAIRAILNDDSLFTDEPEFAESPGDSKDAA